MKNKTICLPDDIFDRLQNVNASALVAELCRNHFQCHGSKDHLQKQLAEIENKKKNIIEIHEKEITELEKKLTAKEKEEFLKKQAEEKEKELEEKTKKIIPKFDIKAYNQSNKSKMKEAANRAFKHYMGREITNEEYDIYMKEYWDVGRPMTEFIEISIKNLPNIQDQGHNDTNHRTEKGENRQAQTEKPYE
jgi:hypothetical protein